jgi:hypothetical protein
MDETSRPSEGRTPAPSPSASESTPRPTYKKPVIRRYDQIEQVKPYGPSELEAG